MIEISTEETGPVRVVTDAVSAADPDRLGEIADYLAERHRQNEELRGIAEAQRPAHRLLTAPARAQRRGAATGTPSGRVRPVTASSSRSRCRSTRPVILP
ncbi:hypothetical protein SVIOM74S_02804 [Streptomyces violarus]